MDIKRCVTRMGDWETGHKSGKQFTRVGNSSQEYETGRQVRRMRALDTGHTIGRLGDRWDTDNNSGRQITIVGYCKTRHNNGKTGHKNWRHVTRVGYRSQ